MNTKKLIGLACWLLAFAVPFQFALLDTESVVRPDGSPNNVKGLLSFVAMVVLLFAGYMFYDGANAKKVASDGHH